MSEKETQYNSFCKEYLCLSELIETKANCIKCFLDEFPKYDLDDLIKSFGTQLIQRYCSEQSEFWWKVFKSISRGEHVRFSTESEALKIEKATYTKLRYSFVLIKVRFPFHNILICWQYVQG